jgi:CheY-like chemotaxis protein
MTNHDEPITILVADDDLEDCLLIKDAMAESRLANDLRFVHDGEELLDYLNRRGRYAEPGSAPAPGLVLLDLNMPRMDGREALREIKGDPALHKIPVVILTTSKAEEDICRSYDLGVNSYIAKPVTFTGLVEVMRALGRYWFEIVALPGDSGGCRAGDRHVPDWPPARDGGGA